MGNNYIGGVGYWES